MNNLAAWSRGHESISVALLTIEPALVRAVQDRLAFHGFLDPPADGVLGPVSQWALAEFCARVGLDFDGSLTPAAARHLLADTPVLPLQPGPDLPGRIAAAMLRHGFWLCRHPDCLTIVYVEAMRPDGSRSSARPNAFDDSRMLLRVSPDGRPVLAGAWEATTSPGRPAVQHPAAPEGAPRLTLGQHKAWVMGHTAIGTKLSQAALVQVRPLPVTRDGNRDFSREGDAEQAGLFVIDQHGGLDQPRSEVDGVGAGCLVGREQSGHRDFMAQLRRDPRWAVNTAYVFMSTLLTWSDLT